MAFMDYFKRRGPGRKRHEPTRDTISYPSLVQVGSNGSRARLAYKPTPRNLRFFARTPYARRAINAIKNPIAMLDWEISPHDGIDMNSELERQIEIATYCFQHPNIDDSSRTLFEAVVEDILLGAGAIELQDSGDKDRPLWMWPVDGLTIQIYPGWTGAPDEARYVQIVGYGNFLGYGGGSQIQLRNDELMYLRPNPSSSTPFGTGPLEVAFNSVSRILGVGEFAGNVATNARPSIALDLGEVADAAAIAAFRKFWRDEVEGQGTMPIWGLSTMGADGKSRGAEVMRLYPEGDTGLYLKYQEFLKAEIATAFDLSPMNLGVERDVNRSTGEVGEDRDRDNAIKPTATLLSSHITRDALHAKLGFYQLRFRFRGLDNEDELEQATVYEHEYRSNAVTPNEYRKRRGYEPMDGEWGDKTFADTQIAFMAARGVAQIEDPSLPKQSPSAKTTPSPKATAKPRKG
jgi:Phage portal protein